MLEGKFFSAMNKRLIDAAMGRIPADLVLKNGVIADVFTGRFIPCDVLVKDGYICGLGQYDCDNSIDVSGKFILPGLIDAHLHIESSMVTPPQYARTVVPHGVTTIIADPHEITNVCGEAGLEFMKKSAEGLPLDIKYMLPSCVPAAPFEHSGAVLTAEDTRRMADDYFGIGEMMNYPGIISGDSEVLGKLAEGKMLDGHAPGLAGQKLDAYINAGIKTDHECSEIFEMLEKIGKGMYIALREGTLSKDFRRLIYGVNSYTFRRCMLCTDDRSVAEILKDGTIDYIVKSAVQLGVEPIMAISMGSVCAATCYGLNDRGAVAPGYLADLLIIDTPHDFNIEAVFKRGVKVAENGKALFDVPACDASAVTNTVHLPRLTAEFFRHEPPEEFTAISLVPDSIITRKTTARRGDRLSKVCVIERHHGTGSKGFGYVTNYGIKNGAIASSVGHDSHNITVIGDNDADMAAAVNALGQSGGICVVSGGEVRSLLELEIAGLMTERGAEYVSATHEELMIAARALGVTESVDPFLSLAFLPLPVIPEIRVTDSGLFDVEAFSFI